MAIPTGHQANFQTLHQAFQQGDVALMECQVAETGEMIAVLCATNRLSNGGMEFVPMAALFNGDPYEMLNPPNPDGGFHSE